jgi:hypothetical protein
MSDRRRSIMQQELVAYQVCVDREGDFPFDATGTQFNDKAETIEHLKETRETRPWAYLSTVTFRRCTDEALPEPPPARTYLTQADWILSFADHGLEAARALQALCNLLSKVEPSGEDHSQNEETIWDFARATGGMLTQLRTIDECFDNIQVRTRTLEDAEETASASASEEPTPDSSPVSGNGTNSTENMIEAGFGHPHG